jgi:hypothetical protein
VVGYDVLTVNQATLVSITITPANPVLVLGTVQQFTATGTFSNQSVQDITTSVTWASSNNTVASISAGGLAAALALGSVTISATSGSISGSTTVTVEPAVLSSITVRPGKGKIAQLTTEQFHAVGTYTDGTTRNLTREVSWTSSDATVATITGTGLASGLAPGTATITATLGSLSGSATLEVTNATVVSITVSPSGRTIALGTRLPFSAVGRFSDNSTQVITRESTWSSDNLAVATIARGGNAATAVGPGTANISATFEGVSGSASLNVSSATLISISVTPASAVLAPTTYVNCVATGMFSDGSTQVLTNVVHWSSSAPTVASASGAHVTALSGGTATITAQFGSVTGGSTITVDSSPLASIQISPPATSIAQRQTFAFRAIGTFADGNSQDLTTFALWTSSKPSVATINAGHATGVGTGTTVVVALFDRQVGTANLTVTAAVAMSSSRADVTAVPRQTVIQANQFSPEFISVRVPGIERGVIRRPPDW